MARAWKKSTLFMVVLFCVFSLTAMSGLALATPDSLAGDQPAVTAPAENAPADAGALLKASDSDAPAAMTADPQAAALDDGHAAAEGAHAAPHLDGSALSIYWVIPFALLLLSIAIMPLAIPKIWHHHYGKIAAGWAAIFAIPCFFAYGFDTTFFMLLETLLLEYVPFILLLLSLFTVSGGIRLKGELVGTPAVNTIILAIGVALASWMGTTGAAMLMIRPMLKANAHRRYRVHQIVFFIFLVANIGGSLTPLGDPPLFLGFLKGVHFFWTLEHMILPMGFVSIILLVAYFIVDTILYKKEGSPKHESASSGEKFGLEGAQNFLLLAAIVGSVLLSGIWKSGISFTVYHVEMHLQDLTRSLIMLAVVFASLLITRKETRRLNEFSWEPILEVGKLFFGIFICMIPAIAILRASSHGALRDLIALVTDANGEPVNAMYFWLTGALSSFLDNAPTYVVFFNTAGGDPVHLTTSWAPTLLAISCGAVFMGANTYIGNAPNFMCRSIAAEAGVKMPSFFGYMAWSIGILVPLFILTTLVFFW